MIRVWSDRIPAGVLDRLRGKGSTFAYDPVAAPDRAVSVTMPVRVSSWDTPYGLAPIFEMNLPEGALRARLMRRFAKATGRFDDVDLLGVVGGRKSGVCAIRRLTRSWTRRCRFSQSTRSCGRVAAENSSIICSTDLPLIPDCLGFSRRC